MTESVKTDRPIKCAVVGQSNAVMRTGFASHLCNQDGIQVCKSGSVGSSSAILGPLFVQPGFCAGVDYCFIDLCIFDYTVQYYAQGCYTGYEIGKYFDWMINVIRADGCQPVILVLYPQWCAERGSWLGDLHVQIARRNACYFFEFRAHLKRMVELHKTAVDAFYSDGNHPTSECQLSIAQCLARFVRQLRSRRLSIKTIRRAIPSFDIVRLCDCAGSFEIVHRQSSLVSFDFCRLRENDEILVTNAECSVHGFVINSSECSANLEIAGETSVVKNLQLATPEAKDLLRVQIAPIFANLRDAEGQFRVRIAPPQTPVTEPHIVVPVKGQSAACATVEIGALIVEKAAVMIEYVAAIPDTSELDIVASDA